MDGEQGAYCSTIDSPVYRTNAPHLDSEDDDRVRIAHSPEGVLRLISGISGAQQCPVGRWIVFMGQNPASVWGTFWPDHLYQPDRYDLPYSVVMIS